ncbi:MAG TPA: hypothetical protein VMX79_07880 [bacterium]|nr:hypothetical protein [bacterium]
MNDLLIFTLVAYVFQFFGLVALFAAAGAALYCAVQMKKVLAELQRQTETLRRLAGEPPAEKEAPGE